MPDEDRYLFGDEKGGGEGGKGQFEGGCSGNAGSQGLGNLEGWRRLRGIGGRTTRHLNEQLAKLRQGKAYTPRQNKQIRA